MARETVFTAIIPAILIFFLVFFNIRKMQKQAKIMKMEHEGKCGGGCAGCEERCPLERFFADMQQRRPNLPAQLVSSGVEPVRR